MATNTFEIGNMDSSLFPPYNALAVDGTTVHPDWGAIVRTIPTMPKAQKEDIAKLIMEHWRLNLMTRMSETDAAEHMRSSSIPYTGKTGPGRRGVVFNVNKLPPELQLIIAKCVINYTNNSG